MIDVIYKSVSSVVLWLTLISDVRAQSWHPTGIDVTTRGIIGDGVTDNAAALQTLVNSVAAPLGGQLFYFPAGLYKVSATLDFSRLRCFAIRGDGTSSGGAGPGTTIMSSAAGPAINVDYGTSIGSFQISGIYVRGTSPTAVAIYARHAAFASIREVQLGGATNLQLDDCLGCSLRSIQFNVGTLGLNVQGGYANTLESGDFNGGAEGLRVGGSTNFSAYGCRWEVMHTAINLGVDSDGNPSPVVGAFLEGITGEANDYHLVMQGCSDCWLSGIGLDGTTNAPAGLSIIGVSVTNCQRCLFAGLGAGGAYSDHSIIVDGASSNLLFVGCSAINGATGKSAQKWLIGGNAITADGTYAGGVQTQQCSY